MPLYSNIIRVQIHPTIISPEHNLGNIFIESSINFYGRTVIVTFNADHVISTLVKCLIQRNLYLKWWGALFNAMLVQPL